MPSCGTSDIKKQPKKTCCPPWSSRWSLGQTLPYDELVEHLAVQHHQSVSGAYGFFQDSPDASPFLSTPIIKKLARSHNISSHGYCLFLLFHPTITSCYHLSLRTASPIIVSAFLLQKVVFPPLVVSTTQY